MEDEMYRDSSDAKVYKTNSKFKAFIMYCWWYLEYFCEKISALFK